MKNKTRPGCWNGGRCGDLERDLFSTGREKQNDDSSVGHILLAIILILILL